MEECATERFRSSGASTASPRRWVMHRKLIRLWRTLTGRSWIFLANAKSKLTRDLHIYLEMVRNLEHQLMKMLNISFFLFLHFKILKTCLFLILNKIKILNQNRQMSYSEIFLKEVQWSITNGCCNVQLFWAHFLFFTCSLQPKSPVLTEHIKCWVYFYSLELTPLLTASSPTVLNWQFT